MVREMQCFVNKQLTNVLGISKERFGVLIITITIEVQSIDFLSDLV